MSQHDPYRSSTELPGQAQDERTGVEGGEVVAGVGASTPPHLQRRGPGGGGLDEAPVARNGHHPHTPASEDAGASGADPVFTPERKVRFLDALAAHGNVRVAAARVGLSRSGVYLARRRDAEFAAGWLAALVLARDHAEAVLAERALDGVEEPIYYRGELIAVRRRFDTRLLLAHLARLDQLCTNADAVEEAARFDTVLGAVAGLPEAEEHDQDSGEPVCWPPRDEFLVDAQQCAIAERIDPGPVMATAAAEWDAFHTRLWAAVDACLEGAPTEQEPLECKSLGKVGAVPAWTLSNVSTAPAPGRSADRACRPAPRGLALERTRATKRGAYG